MQIITLVIVLAVVFKMLAEYEPINKRIDRRDADPNNSIKSNKYLKAHPEWKGNDIL